MRSASGKAKTQGNRVKASFGDEAFEEVVVPSGDFPFQAQGILSGGFADQVESDVFDGGEVGRGVFGSEPAFVIFEDHVHDPMETVLDRPMVADHRSHLVGRERQ
jgi:hypothetical protein